MCHQEWSSFVANERYQAGLIDYQIKYKDNIDIALDTIDNLPDLCSVSFIGGEFFLVDNNIKILEKIKQRKLTATITTNATVMNQPMIDILKEINDVEIRISVDGVEDGFEFIRYPANWNTWQNNVNYLRQQLPHADICCSAVFQLLNCQQIHELYEWANRSKITLAHQMLSQPHSLRFSVLDSTERALLGQLLIDKQQQKYLLAKSQKEVIDDLINMVHNVEFDFGHRSQFIDLLSKLCAQRKTSSSQIQKQFGVLTKLATEVIDRIKIIESGSII
jgi:sulfatase maturation enzyme AslB (radical SAM superfamily)